MRRQERVMKYNSRVKKLMEEAKASLKDKFTAEKIPHISTMLEGIALESFKRGLTDELLYAVSVQEPTTLENAMRTATRIESDMLGNAEKKGSLYYVEGNPTDERSKYVFFNQRDNSPKMPWISQFPNYRKK